MGFTDTYFSPDDRYSLGVHDATGEGYLSIPVSQGIVDYEEYYVVTLHQYDAFLSDRRAAADFADACRRQEHDDLLMIRPGWNRGTPV